MTIAEGAEIRVHLPRLEKVLGSRCSAAFKLDCPPLSSFSRNLEFNASDRHFSYSFTTHELGALKIFDNVIMCVFPCPLSAAYGAYSHFAVSLSTQVHSDNIPQSSHISSSTVSHIWLGVAAQSDRGTLECTCHSLEARGEFTWGSLNSISSQLKHGLARETNT